MEMTEDDIKVITSCRKRLGKPKQYSGNLTFEDQPTKTNCCEPKGFKMTQWIAGITRGHNAGVCLLKDIEVIFALEEERLS